MLDECEVEAVAREAEPLPLWRIVSGKRRCLTRLDRCHLIVAGTLEARDARLFGAAFGGAVLIGRGTAKLSGTEIAGDTSLAALDFSSLMAAGCRLAGGDAGVACAGFSRARLRRCVASGAKRAGFEAVDDSLLLASDCSTEGCGTAVWASGDARAVWRGGSARGALGACVDGAASLRTSGCDWTDSRVSARGRSSYRSLGDRWRGADVALETLGRAAARAARARIENARTGLWAQNESRLDAGDCEILGCGCGLKASHRSRAAAERTRASGEAGFHVEDGARLSLSNCYDAAGPAAGERRGPEANR